MMRLMAVVAVAGGMVAVVAGAGAATKQDGRFATLQAGTGMGLSIEGVAQITRTGHSTSAKVHVRGLEPGTTYAAHLHMAPCAAPNPGGGHYKHEPAGPVVPPNELWLSSSEDPQGGIVANSGGVAHGRGDAGWVARPEAQAIVIHAIPAGGTTAGGPKIACADLGE